MNRTMWLLAGLLAVGTAGPVSAQGIRPITRPPVSPYLNMFRGGNPALNYYGLVRPQIEANRFMQQQELLNWQEQNQTGQTTGATMTGHPTRFLSYQQYFMTMGSGATGAVGGVGGARPGVGTGQVGAFATAVQMPQRPLGR